MLKPISCSYAHFRSQPTIGIQGPPMILYFHPPTSPHAAGLFSFAPLSPSHGAAATPAGHAGSPSTPLPTPRRACLLHSVATPAPPVPTPPLTLSPPQWQAARRQRTRRSGGGGRGTGRRARGRRGGSGTRHPG
jgi:hypothetical protein